ncbi:NAD(P)/FAD-dependent oxidoreductase [Amycolatopsis pithecellobii]|uniref:NAD(P)/FAD-dependent oxidoreductase n=1 Tax=Amycolatopsis pithecellobii TaxID=664692 RepID=A0A6N7YP28_9PSEU|nr:FAD-dependent oxidoreductase [Amycolatopsis pithecellobii]MTD54755.1 NAD(P)/FAD-dependent oxidoreductase [Amycolatopsis pithecellobii]
MAGLVVVGAGLAGLRGAEAARRLGYAGDVTIVGDEPHRPYNRPPLSKQLLGGALDQERAFFNVDALDATWLLGRTATGLDVERRVVRLDDTELPYEKLLIATGCRPRSLPQQLDGVHLLRTLDDALALRKAADNHQRAVIIGAGFLGCEIAATFRGLGLEVSLVDVAEYPMAILGAEVGTRAGQWHRDAGVDLHLGTGVDEVLGSDRVTGVRLSDGQTLPTDLLVVAIGALPNSEWLLDSGLTLKNGGVLSDDRCLAVGHPEIGVAGDVAAWPHPLSDEPVRVEHWTNAAEMAITAATNLYGDEPTRYQPVLTFWSDQYDCKLRAVGLVRGADTAEVVLDEPERHKLVVELHREGELTGAITVNANDKHLQYRRRLQSGTSTAA